MKRFFSGIFILMLVLGTTCLFSKVKVGEEVLERFETQHPYVGKKGVVWEQVFHWPNAGYIAIHFSEFDLAKNDYVEISGPDGRKRYMYKDKGKKVKQGRETISEFWAAHIPGDTAIVRLYSKNKKGGWGFVIDKWARGYERGYIDAVMADIEDAQIEAICSSDDKEWAKCYEGTTMYDKSKTVCRLLINGTSACTGWLLGSEGHVMTNNHCIATQDDASNTDYEFMAEGATCSTNCASWMACEGTLVVKDGTLIRNDSALDYSLILLAENVTGLYGYLQFRNDLPEIDERIYIPQHPMAWGKQLAVNSDTDGPYAKIYSTNESPCTGGSGDIGYYADTAGGSSGSPVLGYDDNLVVALHHCANCPNRGVPIPAIISDLGSNLPNDAIGGGAPPAPPVADFSADPTTVQVGSSVQFTDLSLNTPTSWNWTFEGGTPTTSPAQDPLITYNTIGTYTVTLWAANAAGDDTETKTNYITVEEIVINYCNSSGNNQNYEFIAGVNVADISNTSGASPYSDFTYMTANLTEGASTSVSLTPGFTSSSYTEYWKIWIDYNVDGDFEDLGEEVFSGSGSSTVNGSFTPSPGTDGVITRMRVSMKYGSYPTPCETFTYGEVEDYTVEISGGVGLPVADFTASATNIRVGDSINFTDQSTGNPTSWNWTFEGGNPDTSTNRNPMGIKYYTEGTYNVSLTVTNACGSDTKTKVDYINVSDTVYCTAWGYTQHIEYISGVEVADLDNSSGPSQYTDFTNLTAHLNQGETVNVKLTPEFTGGPRMVYWRIWIDYNGDYDFEDADEEVFSGPGSSTLTGSFTVPCPTIIGDTRMRVRMAYAYYSFCGMSIYGEVEDYTVNITATPITYDVGNSEVFTSTSESDYRRAQPVTMPQDGCIKSVTMYHEAGIGSDKMILAVYDGEGSPQNRIAETPLDPPATIVNSTADWQTITLVNPVPVTGGSTIWLAWVYESNPGIKYQGGSPGRFQSGNTWNGGMPDQFGPGTQADNIYSIYATYTIPTTCAVGNRDLFSSTFTHDPRRAQPFTMPEDGTIESVTMYHTGGSGHIILAVYDGEGSPQNRIAETPLDDPYTTVNSTPGWQTIPLVNPVFVTGGSTIWLAWVIEPEEETTTGIRRQSGSPGAYVSDSAWQNGMPEQFGNGSPENFIYSIYATYTRTVCEN